ncbi:MAG: hypothetical protein VXW49_12270, partial [Pseudomonadota bacterium]|nr:hypothetical protein [Pseudomonadota bacterium]
MLYKRTNPTTGETEFILCDWKRMRLAEKDHDVPPTDAELQAEFQRLVGDVLDMKAPAFADSEGGNVNSPDSFKSTPLWKKV